MNQQQDRITNLVIPLGQTHTERLESIQQIKDAMTACIMQRVEQELINDGNDPVFLVLQTIYLEANHTCNALRKE